MANPTTNYGFVLPTSTDLVTDLPADFDVALQGVDTRLKALQPGTTLGDLFYASATANTNTRLGIGSTGNVLTVAAGVASWAAPAASASYTVIGSGTMSGTSVSVTGISGTYKRLVAIYDNYYISGTDTTVRIRINSATGSNYNVATIPVTAGTYGFARLTAGFLLDEVNIGSASANDNQVVVQIEGYASNTFHSYNIAHNPTSGAEYVYFGANTTLGEPITSIQFQTANGTTSFAGGAYAVYGVS